MQNIHRAILPNTSISHDTIENIGYQYLFSKVLDSIHVVFVDKPICNGETTLFVSWVKLF